LHWSAADSGNGLSLGRKPAKPGAKKFHDDQFPHRQGTRNNPGTQAIPSRIGQKMKRGRKEPFSDLEGEPTSQWVG